MWTVSNPNPPIINTKYQIDNELWLSRNLKYKVVDITRTTYGLLPININDTTGEEEPNFSGYQHYPFKIIDENLYLSMYKYINKPIQEAPKCECGAAKLGYVKPGRQHYNWCSFYKE